MIKQIYFFGTSHTAGGGFEFDSSLKSFRIEENDFQINETPRGELLKKIYSKLYLNEELTQENFSFPGQFRQLCRDRNIDVEVIDLRTIRPMDYQTIIESVKKTNRLVILEESWPFGNIATEITYHVQSEIFDYLDAPVEKINTADTPAPYSPVLLKEWLPNAEDVVKSIKKVLYK